MRRYGWLPLVFIFGLAVGTFADPLPAIITGVVGGVVIQQLWSRFVEE